MPWNQPGSGGNKDPWGGGGGRQSPPDLDDIVKNVQKRLGGLLGGRGGGGGKGGGSASTPNKFGLFVGVLAAIAFWAWQSIYIVEQGIVGIELRFGQYSETTQAGLQWAWWPIEEVILVNTQKVNTVEVGYRTSGRNRQSSTVPREALMLTADENIVDLELAVQYNIKGPTDLVFYVAEYPQNTEAVVRGATESALREVVGSNQMDFVLTDGRPEVAQRTRALLQTILDRYRTGINVIAVEMQDAQPPKEVKAAFDDAVKAREDQVRLINEAEAYANDIIPRARGRAARIIQEAEAYKAAVIARAEGEASRFSQILTEYQVAPDITRDRLYLESLEQVLTNSSKLMLDQTGGNNVIYLPLDQLIRQRRLGGANTNTSESENFTSSEIAGSGQAARERFNLRDRGRE
ncbi:MAG: FtsH protease activity modulator HflK [Arenicellales bacterium]|nr:FtsH protease activity modulator HflK [Arenicellales bacterium]